MVDFHVLWGPRPAESAALNVGHVKVVENKYIVVNIPETKTTARPAPLPLSKVSFIQDPVFLDSALNAYVSMMKYLDIHPGFPDKPPLNKTQPHKRMLMNEYVSIFSFRTPLCWWFFTMNPPVIIVAPHIKVMFECSWVCD
jgi:hypothetical protein